MADTWAPGEPIRRDSSQYGAATSASADVLRAQALAITASLPADVSWYIMRHLPQQHRARSQERGVRLAFLPGGVSGASS